MPQLFTWIVKTYEDIFIEQTFMQALEQAAVRFSPRCILTVQEDGATEAKLLDADSNVIASAIFMVNEGNEITWYSNHPELTPLSPWFEKALGEDALTRLMDIMPDGSCFFLDDDWVVETPDFHIKYPTPKEYNDYMMNRMMEHLPVGMKFIVGGIKTGAETIDRIFRWGEGYSWLNNSLPPADNSQKLTSLVKK